MQNKLFLIVINGFPRSGKDTFVRMCSELLPNFEFKNISSVDKVKEAALILGWDGVKDERGRKFLSNLKDMSTFFYNGPLAYMIKQIETVDNLRDSIVFFHIREPEEIKKFIELYPQTITICLHRHGCEPQENTGDRSVMNYDYDYHVDNDRDLDYLKNEAEIFINYYLLRKEL